MNISNRLVGSRSRECVEQFYQTRLVRVTRGAFAIWLNPFGMLDAKVVVNLFPKLGVGEDFVKHGNLLWGWAIRLATSAPYKRRCRSRMAGYARLGSRRRDFHRSLRKLPDR